MPTIAFKILQIPGYLWSYLFPMLSACPKCSSLMGHLVFLLWSNASWWESEDMPFLLQCWPSGMIFPQADSWTWLCCFQDGTKNCFPWVLEPGFLLMLDFNWDFSSHFFLYCTSARVTMSWLTIYCKSFKYTMNKIFVMHYLHFIHNFSTPTFWYINVSKILIYYAHWSDEKQFHFNLYSQVRWIRKMILNLVKSLALICIKHCQCYLIQI